MERIFPTRYSPIPGSSVPIIDGAPREEVVRCRDCLYWIDEDFCNNPMWYQPHSIYRPCTDYDGFCAWAERDE